MEIATSQRLNHRIELVKGDSTVTIKQFVESTPGQRVALLNSDLDGYYLTAAIFEHIYPFMIPGGVIAFDEYGARHCGESDAVDGFSKTKINYRSFPWAFSPTAYVVKESIGST